ncbi:hypothetical protein ACFPPA_14440 [Rhodanobacter ginsengisoli]|uniref:Permease n=1 Tax=Rhodanobacter ginsengisoli TaxID=418646 RepID=A0ABW0QQ77_9GAMM
MTRLALEQGPQVSLPRRFLLSAPPWGMAGGVLLCVDGESLLLTRWHPATLALVHIYTLGVLGNVMFGSLLQFLPVAAGVRVHALARLGPLLHVLLNLGVLLLVSGLYAGWTAALIAAAVVLPLTFALLCVMTLPGLVAAVGQRMQRVGFGVALGSTLLTALLGGGLALHLGGGPAMPVPALVDVHASWGILGWVIVLLGTVTPVVMPMFQGTATVPAPIHAAWLGGLLLALLAGAWWRLGAGDGAVPRLAFTVCVLLFASAGLWLQWRAPRPRRGPLWWSWRAGLVVLLLAASALSAPVREGRLAAALGLGIALPLLVNGMLLEIVAFLGWIELHRRIGRGVQLPGVQRLLPEREKYRALLLQLPLAVLLPAAVLWPASWLARSAGLAMLLAWLGVGLACLGVRHRVMHFQTMHEGAR